MTEGRTITISGLPWFEEPKSVGIAAVTAKILCEEHNKGLAPLDEHAGRFFKAIQKTYDVVSDLNSKPANNSFDGCLLKRCLIKVVFGLVASGSTPGVRSRGEMLRSLAPYLLGQAELPTRWGMYISPVLPVLVAHPNAFQVAIFGDSAGAINWFISA